MNEKKPKLVILDNGLNGKDAESFPIFLCNNSGNSSTKTSISIENFQIGNGNSPIFSNYGDGEAIEFYKDLDMDYLNSCGGRKGGNVSLESCKIDRVVLENQRKTAFTYGEYGSIDITSGLHSDGEQEYDTTVYTDGVRANSLNACIKPVDIGENSKSNFSSVLDEVTNMQISGYRYISIDGARTTKSLDVSDSDSVEMKDFQSKGMMVTSNNNKNVRIYGSHIDGFSGLNGKNVELKNSSFKDTIKLMSVGKVFGSHITAKNVEIEDSVAAVYNYSTIGKIKARKINTLQTHGSEVGSIYLDGIPNARFIRTTISPIIKTYDGQELGGGNSELEIDESNADLIQCTIDGTKVEYLNPDNKGNTDKTVRFNNCNTINPAILQNADILFSLNMYPGDRTILYKNGVVCYESGELIDGDSIGYDKTTPVGETPGADLIA